jgi:hypothetical protein
LKHLNIYIYKHRIDFNFINLQGREWLATCLE